MTIGYVKVRKSKQPNNSKTRQLAEEWAALMEAHSRVLERGAKAKGVKAKDLRPTSLSPAGPVRHVTNEGLVTKSVPMRGAGTLPTQSEDMLEAKRALSSRVGLSYNKGGLQYLTDDELKEQRTGVHKRR